VTQRHRTWADRIFQTQLVDGATLLQNLLVNAPTIDTITAVRVLLDLTASTDPAASTELDVRIDVGIGVVNTEAFNVGVTAVPNPANEAEYPPRGWLYVATRRVTLQNPGVAGALRLDGVFHADVRSMRKVDKGILFILAKNTVISDTGTVRIVGRSRVLCLT